MSRQISDEHFELIWSRIEEEIPNYPTRTNNQWDEPIIIFGDWADVEKVAEIVYTTLPQSVIDDLAPSFLHLPYEVNPHHHIEWAIGDYSFTDSYMQCAHCQRAIDIQDYIGPRYYIDYVMGDLICDICLRENSDFREDYLSYCVAHLEEESTIAYSHLADPIDYGYICINAASAYGDYGLDDWLNRIGSGSNQLIEDIDDWPNGLTYPSGDIEVRRLAQSARLVDEHIHLLAQYHPTYGNAYMYWLKWADGYNPIEDEPHTSRAILLYAASRILSRYEQLRRVAYAKKNVAAPAPA